MSGTFLNPYLCACQTLSPLRCPIHNPSMWNQASQWYPALSGGQSLYLPSGDPALERRSDQADQPFVGFRAWQAESSMSRWRLTPFSPVRYLPTGVRLKSLNHNVPQPWDEVTAHASCMYTGASAHHQFDKRSPTRDCSCGLYTWRRPQPATARSQLWGAVLIWGRVLEHDEGFRSEHAKIICFADNGNEITEYAARERGIPVVPPDKVAIYAGEFGRVFP